MDTLFARLAELGVHVVDELHTRSLFEWLFFFAPILIFLEIPRYHLPLLFVWIADRLGFPRHDARARGALLARKPSVSVVIAGRNEAATIEAALASLLDQDWPNVEIIVVDDASEDAMYEVVARYARRGMVRLVRNASGRGRSGRPSATNLGIRLTRGEFILSVDADTTFDRRTIEHMLAPFADPAVGVVAGNVMVRNLDAGLLAQCQALEYGISIDLHKRWTDLLGCTMQASGAIGAFRRSAVTEQGGWSQEVAEDADISMRMIKAGWKIAFAPRAVALTEVPSTLKGLVGQRHRWDRGALRTYFHKHDRLMRPSAAGWSVASELWSELLFSVIATLVYPLYLIYLVSQGWFAVAFVTLVTSCAYVALSGFSLFVLSRVSERVYDPWRLWRAALVTPLYKAFFRWVRLRAFVMELLRVRYEDSYLPDSAWAHAPRF